MSDDDIDQGLVTVTLVHGSEPPQSQDVRSTAPSVIIIYHVNYSLTPVSRCCICIIPHMPWDSLKAVAGQILLIKEISNVEKKLVMWELTNTFN